VRRESLSPYLWMLCGSFCFSVMVICAKRGYEVCDWQTVAFFRAFLVFLFAAMLALGAGAPLVLFRPRVLWLRSLAGSASMLCTFYAFNELRSEEVVTLTNMFPIWVVLLSWSVAQESPAGPVWLSIGSGVAGVALIQQPHFVAGHFAALSAVAASVFTAFAMMGLNRLRGLDTRAIVVHFSAVASMTCLAAYFIFPHKTASPLPLDGGVLLLLLAVGVTATVGQICLTKAFASSNAPARVSVVGLTQIVFVMVMDRLIDPHGLEWYSMAGTLLIVAPTAWLLLRTKPGAPTVAAAELVPVTNSSPRPSAAAVSSAAPAPASSPGRSGSGRAVGGSS
jgi:drug/metabolite transporter (DMT)-like permease